MKKLLLVDVPNGYEFTHGTMEVYNRNKPGFGDIKHPVFEQIDLPSLLRQAFEVGRNFQLTGENNFDEFLQMHGFNAPSPLDIDYKTRSVDFETEEK